MMLLALLLAASACPPATEASVRATFEDWLVAYRARDLTGTMAIFDPRVRFQFQGSPDLDWAALRRNYQAEFAATARSEWRAEWDQIIVSGDLATAFATWREHVGDAPEPRAENRSVDVLQRGEGCRWRIVRSLNYPVRAAGRSDGGGSSFAFLRHGPSIANGRETGRARNLQVPTDPREPK